MDAWLVAAVCAEIDGRCRGGRIERVGQPAAADIYLRVHLPGGDLGLLLSADRAHPRAHLVRERLPNPPVPPPFCQVLRRHIEGARVEACCQQGMERCLELLIAGRDDLGNPRQMRLVAELTGALANLVLVGPDGCVVDALRRVDTRVNRVREVLPGRAYRPPPRPPDRIDPVLLVGTEGPDGAVAAIRSAIAAAGEGAAPDAALRGAVFGLAPHLAAAITVWSAGRDGAPPAPPGAAPPAGRGPDADALARTVVAVAWSIRTRDFRPCVLRRGTRVQASAWPLAEWSASACPTPSEACLAAFGETLAASAAAERRRRLAEAVRTAVDRTERRLGKQREELAAAEAAGALREAGELLLAFGHLVPRGAAEAWLPSFEEPERRVRVRLDPAASAAANAQRLLRRYQRLHRAQAGVGVRAAASERELLWLRAAAVDLSPPGPDAGGALDALEEALEARGVLARRGRRAGGHPGPDRARPRAAATARASAAQPVPLRYAAGDGWVVLVGRSAAGNDRLTMRDARPDDIWLHARQMPGSHVLLRAPADRPAAGAPEAVLVRAAQCAARHSAGRDAARVAVDYTERRNVWKPAGASPGFVRYRGERTLYVSPTALPALAADPEPAPAPPAGDAGAGGAVPLPPAGGAGSSGPP